MSNIKLLIVDDHQMIREGLVAMLGPRQDIDIIGCCSNAEEALEFVTRHIPDVILMDIKMQKMNGIEATREITSLVPGIKIIMLTIFENAESVRLSLQAGATGYMLKQASQEKLAESINQVYRGKTVIDPVLINQLIKDYARIAQNSFNLPHPLTKDDKRNFTLREHEILKHLSQGLSNKEISEKTRLAVNTVKAHLRNIYRKMGVKSRSQVISKIIKQNGNFKAQERSLFR
ncbi:response regulator transcription factor [Pelotomaculum terephthalicicum JT]|uniref:response regulator n=1 Tax=Pelotomaculum TaxID=191373 RepID=UPI0009CBD54B|nr:MULTISPECIES: response regulator transcription factor [Pelotomaculum]MCG9967207.1 response regulator transcription factor [Pelotomaculum terephthalicicum JT]OPX86959.1 MAG: Oxygen regulatory protein NreC [Pelotomaculum sp. PtaB.Bin117]OPY61550.1 MAG: Oxygen regulatory protein NreC [Pelotomaculum sp. PtaU1.Bin065]